VRKLKIFSVLLALGFPVFTCRALIPPECADASTAEGWQAVGFPVDDYLPWSLELQGKEIAQKEGKYVVVMGYLVSSSESIVLFPNADAARSGRMDGTLILNKQDSPALRWLFPECRAEGWYAVGGVFSLATKAPMLGHLGRIRFAMKKGEANQAPVPTATSVTPAADAPVAPAAAAAQL